MARIDSVSTFPRYAFLHCLICLTVLSTPPRLCVAHTDIPAIRIWSPLSAVEGPPTRPGSDICIGFTYVHHRESKQHPDKYVTVSSRNSAEISIYSVLLVLVELLTSKRSFTFELIARQPIFSFRSVSILALLLATCRSYIDIPLDNSVHGY